MQIEAAVENWVRTNKVEGVCVLDKIWGGEPLFCMRGHFVFISYFGGEVIGPSSRVVYKDTFL